MRLSRGWTPALVGGVFLIVTVVGIGLAAWGMPVPTDSALDGTTDGDTALGFENVATERGFEYTATDDTPTTVGNSRGGVYVTDFNNDGRADVLATGGEQPVLFENTGGQYERSEVLPADLQPTGALFFDYDNDGWEDLLVFEWDSSPTFFENEAGSFEQRDVGFDENLTVSNAATAFDYDGNGCLDVFVAQTGDWRNDLPWQAATGEPYEEPGSRGGENGNENLLYAGDCSNFERATDTGISGTHWSTATSAADFDGDGLADLHVANDFYPDVLYHNLGDGTFEREIIPNTNRHGMASDVADVNGDGRMDVFVTNVHFAGQVWQVALSEHMSNDGNSLLVSQADGSFASMEDSYGVTDGGWGWAAGIADFDNDGHEDLVHTTQLYIPFHENRAEKFGDPVDTRPRFWFGGHEGFEEANERRLGLAPSDGRGMVHLDYDRDGDQDLVIADVNASSSYKLFENTLESENEWLQVRLQADDRPVVGSGEVCVVADDGTRCQSANAKADLLSQDTRVLHFGLGDASSVTLRVTWPDGSVDTIEDVSTSRRVVVSPGGSVSEDKAASERVVEEVRADFGE